MTDIPTPTYSPRNFRLGVINGVLFILAETLLDPTLVLVAFLSHLTQSPLLLGLVVPIRDGAWSLPQLWVSGYLQSLPRKISLYRRISVIRISVWFLLAFIISFVRDPAWLLVTFFIGFAASSLASGLSGLPFLEVVGKTIHPRRVGEFFAWRYGLGGLLSIGGSLLVRWLLDAGNPLQFPQNFGLLAFLYAILASISLIAFNGVDEPADVQVLPRASFRNQVRRARQVLKHDRNYRRYIFLASMLMIAGAATPFFAVYVQQRLGGSPEMIGVYLGVFMVTTLIANPVFGRVSYRYSNRLVITLGAVAGIAMSGLVLALALLAGPLGISGQVASLWLIPVFIFAGVRGTGIGVAGNSLLLEISPPEERSLYLGSTNSFLGIVLLSTGLSGLVLALVGYPVFFLLMVAAHLAALAIAVRIGADYRRESLVEAREVK